MGLLSSLFGSNKTSTTTTSTNVSHKTDVYDNRVGADGGSVAIGSGATVSFVDPGALKLGDAILEKYAEQINKNYGLVEASQKQSSELINKVMTENSPMKAAIIIGALGLVAIIFLK